MLDKETSRLSRLTAILLLLQSKRLVTASSIAEKFNVSIRTVYRDIRTLEDAGVPVLTEEGKGYTLMEGYTLPPVMFTESEANALITAEQLIAANKDASFVKSYTEAITKIKAILRNGTKEKAELLSERLYIRTNQKQPTSNHLSSIQLAITNRKLVTIDYCSEVNEVTQRAIEPLALYSTQDNWIVVAYCRLRNEKRAFRLDRIQCLTVGNETFPDNGFTLQQYFEECKEKASIPLT